MTTPARLGGAEQRGVDLGPVGAGEGEAELHGAANGVRRGEADADAREAVDGRRATGRRPVDVDDMQPSLRSQARTVSRSPCDSAIAMSAIRLSRTGSIGECTAQLRAGVGSKAK